MPALGEKKVALRWRTNRKENHYQKRDSEQHFNPKQDRNFLAKTGQSLNVQPFCHLDTRPT
jgi:hypothetical protein